MINDFISREDLPLFTSGSRFSLGLVFLREGMKDDLATFDLFVRGFPPSRNFLVFGGLEHVVNYLQNLELSNEQLNWLAQQFHFSPEEMEYFRNFKFTGDVWAMPEGTIFFPNEPIIRITAPLIEAQIIEMFLINAIYLQTALASKIARFVVAANGKSTALGFNRSYGTDAAMKATRWSKVFGAKTSLAIYDYKNTDNPPFAVGTFHYLIMAFDSELEAFRKYLAFTKGAGYVLVDTYNSIQGIKNFIKAAKELESEGIKATGIQLDSGDLYELSMQARKMLNEAELTQAKIFAMSNLDEWKVADLEKRGAPIDVYAGVTGLLTPSDAPTLELVYKLSEVKKGEVVLPKMKTSTQKISLPGRKQVYRILKDGKYSGDIITTEQEDVVGEKLLTQVMRQGEVVYSFPTLEEIGKYFYMQKGKFDSKIFDVNSKFDYSVTVSDELRRLAEKTKEEINRVHHYDVDF